MQTLWRATVTVGMATLALACGGSSSPTPTPAKGESKVDAKAAETKLEDKGGQGKADEGKAEAKVPEPEAKPDALAKHPRLEVAPSPDLAVVVTQSGVVVLDGSGKTVGVLSSEKPSECRLDPRAELLWTHRQPTGPEAAPPARGQLVALDLRTEGPPTTVLTDSPSTFVLAYADEELGREESHRFQEGVVVHMSEPPRVEALLGCDGDMSWYCFEDEDEEVARGKKLAELATTLAGQPLPVEVLSGWAARGTTGKATPAGPGMVDAPRKVAVPETGCEEAPEDCGSAKVLPGGRLWRVLVSNSRGDFYHEGFALYDPKTDELVDPSDPAARRKPSAEPQESSFEVEWISPSGELAMGSGKLVRLDGGVLAEDLQAVCGFWGGGWEL